MSVHSRTPLLDFLILLVIGLALSVGSFAVAFAMIVAFLDFVPGFNDLRWYHWVLLFIATGWPWSMMWDIWRGNP